MPKCVRNYCTKETEHSITLPGVLWKSTKHPVLEILEGDDFTFYICPEHLNDFIRDLFNMLNIQAGFQKIDIKNLITVVLRALYHTWKPFTEEDRKLFTKDDIET